MWDLKTVQRVLAAQGMQFNSCPNTYYPFNSAADERPYVVMHGAQIEESQKGTGSNHAISALKFKILREFLDLGYSVLLSDIDIVWLDVSFSSRFLQLL